MMAETGHRYVDATGVAKHISISRSMVDILVKRGILPAPIELTPRLKRWDLHAVDKALAQNPTLAPSTRSVTDISRSIADDIVAQRRLSAAKGARRRHG